MIKKIKSNKEKISATLLVILAFFPVYRPALQSITLITFSLFSIVFYFSNFKKRIKVKQNNLAFFYITGFLFWALLSVLWSTNKSNLFHEIQPSLILLLFPIVIIYFHPKITKQLRIIVFIAFIISNLILSFYLYSFLELGTARWMSFYKRDIFLYESNSIIDKLKYLKQITYKWSFAYGNFMEVSKRDFHKAYTSSGFLISIALSLFLIFKIKIKLLIKVILVIIILYFSVWLLYMKSIVNLIAYSSFVLFIILELKSKKTKLTVTSVLVITAIISIFLLKDNWKTVLKQKYFFQEEYTPMSDEGYIIDYERTKIYRATYALLSKPQTFLLGVGYADCEITLNKKLDKYPVFLKGNWNTHSEFLHFWLSGGVINLLLLLLFFAFIIYKSLKEKNTLLLCIVTIIFFNVIFENYLSRVLGAYIVAFFVCILPKKIIQ